MPYLFFYLIFVLLIVIWSTIHQKKKIKEMISDLRKAWGEVPEEEYTSEKFQSLKAFYQSVKDDKFDVDDITWNDLDMNEIYMLMNNTTSAPGEEYLYALLRKPCFSNKELQERNRLMTFFRDNENQRITLQLEFMKVNKLNSISAFEYMNRLGEQKAKSNIPHYIMAFGFLFSLITIFINPGLGILFTLCFLTNNIFQYYKRKGEIEVYLTVFAFILRLLDGVKGVAALDIPEIKEYTDTLKKDIQLFKKFQKGASIVISKNVSGSPLDALLDYIRMLFHGDLIKFNKMLSFLQSHQTILNRIFTTVGFLDSMIACASFRELLDYYCEPVLTRKGNLKISALDLYHPLLDDPVSNSITENQSVLITGSNASGKSTYIKTLAINAILSQTIYTSVSRHYKANFYIIYSSMALRDSIFQNESYYIVEIKSLKRIMDRINPDIPMLCFIDEVLRGTNTLERIAASSRILASLAKMNALVFAATHDIELTYILENFYSNYHFQEKILHNQVVFDYKLYEGKAVSKNAIKLLGMMGYTNKIIKDAEDAAQEFLTKGEWSKVSVNS